MILLYWDIGRGIVEKQKSLGWGKSVVESLSQDLQTEFPGITGFSPDNLWRMRQFYDEYSKDGLLSLAVRELKHMRSEKFLEQAVPEPGNRVTGEILEQTVPENITRAARNLLTLVPWGITCKS